MKGVPVHTQMSPLEIAVWGAEFVRVRAGDTTSDTPASHAIMSAAIDAADQAVMDLRDAFGTEHSTLAIREVRKEDPAAVFAILKERMTRSPR